MRGVSIVYKSPSLEVGTARNLLVAAWNETPTVADMVGLTSAARALNRPYPKGSGLINLVLRGTPKFTDEVRAAFVKVNSDPMAFSLGSARVLLVGGMAAVAVRAFLNTVSLVSKRVRPVRTFLGVAEAAEWLAPKLSVGGLAWSAAEVEGVASPYVAAAPEAR
jgi:hypothetical protein